VRLACAYAVLATLAAPSALGPAMASVLRELGAQEAHRCKCGMIAGKCGCPECERLEHERALVRTPDAVPALRSHCDDDAPTLLLGALPVAGLASVTGTLSVPRGERLSVLASELPPLLPERDPPTPPPRSAAV